MYKCYNGAKCFDFFNGSSSGETNEPVENSKHFDLLNNYTLSFVDCYYVIISFKYQGL